MKDADIIAAFSALGQEKRLQAFKLLVTREPEGVHAGDLARLTNTPFNTMSAHMAILSRAGLVRGSKSGRFMTYRADIGIFGKILTHLFENCCDSRPELCEPMFEEFTKMISRPNKKASCC